MKLFDKLYNASEETVKLLNKPLVKRRVLRALEGAEDSLEGQRIEAELLIEKQTRDLACGKVDVVPSLIKNRLFLSEILIQIAEARKIREELLSEVPAEKDTI